MSPARAIPLLVLLLVPLSAGADEYEEILAGAAGRSHDASCARMLSWVQQHPQDERAPRALLWMGQLRIADHQLEQAQILLERARRDYPNTEWSLHATKALADL